MSIGNNTTYLQNLLTKVNSLPEISRNMDFEDAFIMKTISSYENTRVKYIAYNKFAYCTSLTSVSFPVCTNIGSYAFQNCTSLTSVNFPVCTNIGYYAFSNCTSLTSVSFPNCTTIREYAFQNCTSLTSVNFPNCTYIDYAAFRNCYSLTTISFPNCTTINGYGSFGAFANCYSLTSVNFPNCTAISTYTFLFCSNLSMASFPNCTNIGDYAFNYCYNLSQVYLTGSYLCKLSNSNAFTSTPFMGYSSYFSGTPYIYVPESLVTSYQNATNWTYFSSYFSTIESLSGIIRFSINGYPYQAENGMTWAEWIDSKYNIDGYVADNGSVYDANFIIQVWLKENTGLHFVSDTDAILSNAAYLAM